MLGLSLVAASGGHSSLRYAGLPLPWPLLLRSTGSRCAGSVVVAHGPSCSAACGILPDQGSNPCPLHWQATLNHCATREAPRGLPLFSFGTMDSIPVQFPANTCYSIYHTYFGAPWTVSSLAIIMVILLIFESRVLTQDLEYSRNAENICVVSLKIKT